jgi:hypothetical protein
VTAEGHRAAPDISATETMQQEWVLDALVLFEQKILLEVGNRGCILCTTLQKDAEACGWP